MADIERVPHVYRFPDGRHTWMCPSRKKGWVWVLVQRSIPTSWGDNHTMSSVTLMPVEDWQAQEAVLDIEEERRIGGMGSRDPMFGWSDASRWP